jgi:hypothetical protein
MDCRLLPLVVVFLTLVSEQPASPSETEKLRLFVERLGAASYQQRATAEKAILQMGPGILPLLDKLKASPDPETVSRLRRIRRALDKYDVTIDRGAVWVNGNLAGLLGQVRVVRGQGSVAAAKNIRITVDLCEAPGKKVSPRADRAAPQVPDTGLLDVPLERWAFDPVTLAKLRKDTNKGADFYLFLPWSTYRPEIRRIILHLRIEAASEAAPADAIKEVPGTLLAETRVAIVLNPNKQPLGVISPGIGASVQPEGRTVNALRSLTAGEQDWKIGLAVCRPISARVSQRPE